MRLIEHWKDTKDEARDFDFSKDQNKRDTDDTAAIDKLKNRIGLRGAVRLYLLNRSTKKETHFADCSPRHNIDEHATDNYEYKRQD